MEILTNKRVYLSSPIEFCTDSSWRTEVKDVLTNTFKLRVYDPHDDDKQILTKDIAIYKENRDYVNLHKTARIFVRKDLSIVDRADIIVAHVPRGTPTTGTVHEIVNGANAKKLTILVEGTDKAKISIWYYGFIKDRFMFGKWDDLYNFFEDVNKGKFIDDDRLFFLYNYPDVWLS